MIQGEPARQRPAKYNDFLSLWASTRLPVVREAVGLLSGLPFLSS